MCGGAGVFGLVVISDSMFLLELMAAVFSALVSSTAMSFSFMVMVAAAYIRIVAEASG